MSAKATIKTVTTNRRARFDYDIKETFEAFQTLLGQGKLSADVIS